MKYKLCYLQGSIEGFKDVMDIKKRCGIYDVSPSELTQDEAYLKGLEDAYNILKGD